MNILLTNDDGIFSEGISALKTALAAEHEVWMVAPDIERSGASHAITLRDAVRMSELDERVYSCGGTPADCVLYTLLGAVGCEPDVVISGINHGPNIGTDIVYSGTVAAARQAAFMGHPGIAVSLVGQSRPLNFGLAADFIARNLDLMISLWLPDHVLNVNVPNVFGIVPNVAVTKPARRIYRDHLVDFTAPNGEKYFFLQGSLNEAIIEPGSDWDVVKNEDISVSPIYLHPLNHSEDEAYHRAVFERPGVAETGA
jgi:5'-nucleotidase